jgi:hypothetical protein
LGQFDKEKVKLRFGDFLKKIKIKHVEKKLEAKKN